MGSMLPYMAAPWIRHGLWLAALGFLQLTLTPRSAQRKLKSGSVLAGESGRKGAVVSDFVGNTLGWNGDCVYIIIYIYNIYIYNIYIIYIYIHITYCVYIYIAFYFLMMISIAVIVSIVIIWSLVTPRTRAENRLQQVARPRPRPWRVVVFLCSIFCHTLFAISRV
jgi:hypothetical protein